MDVIILILISQLLRHAFSLIFNNISWIILYIIGMSNCNNRHLLLYILLWILKLNSNSGLVKNQSWFIIYGKIFWFIGLWIILY